MMNILIVGLGSIARKHIIALNSLEKEFNIYALRSGTGGASQIGITDIYNISDFNGSIDFAIISNPTNLHYHFINILVDRGIPLFIEKPPLATLKDASYLADKIHASGIMTYVACNLRFHPCLQYIKKFLDTNKDKRINEVNIYCGSYLPEWRPNRNFREIYSVNADMGGGVHLDLFHELDYTHWIFGDPLKVQCIKRSNSSLNINAVDYANYLLEYDKFATNIILNYYKREPKRSISILFDDETWEIDLLNSTIKKENGTIIYKADDFLLKNTYRDQMLYFINCLTDNQMPMNTFMESLGTLKICLRNE